MKIGIFDMVLEGASFLYKGMLFQFLRTTSHGTKEFVSYQVFEDDRTIAFVKRQWIITKEGNLVMKRDKDSLIWSKKRNALYNRILYNNGGWKKLFFGIGFSKSIKHYGEKSSIMLNEFAKKVAEHLKLDESYGRINEMQSMLLYARVGFVPTRKCARDAEIDHIINNTPLKEVYKRLKKGVYWRERENGRDQEDYNSISWA